VTGSRTTIDVLVVGAIGVDTNVYLPSSDGAQTQVEGASVDVRDCVAHAGGYASRGYAALGWRTAYLGHVGDDPHGGWVRQTLEQDGILTEGLVTTGRTARSVNLVSPDGSRRNFYDPRVEGATPPDAATTKRLVRASRVVHLNIPDWARHVLPLAHAAGVPVVVDVQDAQDPPGVAEPYRSDFVSGADLLFSSGAGLPDPEAYAREAMAAGRARAVVVGLGSRGALLVPRDGPAVLVGPVALQPEPDVDRRYPVVDTNGAGDSLAVGVTSAHLLQGRDLVTALTCGQVCARWCCTLRGTSDGLITAAELDRQLDRQLDMLG